MPFLFSNPFEFSTVVTCSKTSYTERAMVIGLGGLNLFGVVILSTILKYGSIKLFSLFFFGFFGYCTFSNV